MHGEMHLLSHWLVMLGSFVINRGNYKTIRIIIHKYIFKQISINDHSKLEFDSH